MGNVQLYSRPRYIRLSYVDLAESHLRKHTMLRTSKSLRLGNGASVFAVQRRNKVRLTEPSAHVVKTKPFSEVPGPKGALQIAASIFDTIKSGGLTHNVLGRRFEKYGPLYKEHLGVTSFIYMKDVEAVEDLLRSDPDHPQRMAIESWLKWREMENLTKGILIENDGPVWKRMRVPLDKLMMRPKRVTLYTETFNDVITDFMKRLVYIRDVKSDGKKVPHLDKELFHWSLETIGAVLYERRFGSMNVTESQDGEMNNFVNAVQNIMTTTHPLIYLPMRLAKYVMPKVYKEHCEAWTTVFSIGKRMIDEKMEDIQRSLDKGEEVDGFLSSLVLSQTLSLQEIYSNVTELMLAAGDTTSNTMQWVIYELARHPDIQDQLRQEIMSTTNGDVTDQIALQKMPYLRGVIKEILRLYPVPGALTRLLHEDLVIGGYLVPKGTTVLASTYYMGRDPQNFEDAEKFKPERWLRGEASGEKVHTFAWVPFGFGARACIGRRIAELEMLLLTAGLIQKFVIRPASPTPILPVTRGLMVPERCVDVHLIDVAN